MRNWPSYLLGAILGCSSGALMADVVDSGAETGAQTEPARFGFGDRGLEFVRGNTNLWLGLRGQFRYSSLPGSLKEVDDLKGDESDDFGVRRARIKGGGRLLVPWLDVYSEYNLKDSAFLDYRATATVAGWLDIRVGQWKSEFNRERIISSGKQQLADRSISNYWFALDRQRGLSTTARFDEGGKWDTRIWIQALSGTGQNNAFEQNQGLLLTRLQWNANGVELPFEGSDLGRRETPAASVALAYVTGDSPYTRFSDAGGGQLPGFSEGDYELEQFLLETAFQHRGLSWEQELHFKKIRDERTGQVTRLAGGYAQLGTFPSEWWPGLPAPLSIAGRVALVDPDMGENASLQQEWTLGANWFFNGDRNKLTFDLSWLDFEDPVDGASKLRVRLQWDVSI